MLPAADSASGAAGQPEAAGGGAAGSHGPGGETGGRGAPAAAGEEGAAEDEEDDDPRASRFVLAVGLGLLAASVALLGQELSGPGGGGWPGWALLLPLRLALYAGCAAAAASLGALLGLLWRGRRLPPPSFPAAAGVPLPPSNWTGSSHDSVQSRRVVISHNMDKALKEVFDYIYRDYILSWYGQLSRDEGQLYQLLSEDFWEIAKQLRLRLSHIDVVKVVCNDVVKALLTHFCDLKGANARFQGPNRHHGICKSQGKKHLSFSQSSDSLQSSFDL